MSRTVTAAERAAVAALRSGHHAKFEVQDADGVYRDYTTYLRTEFFTGATISENQDVNTISLSATLIRESGTLSLSPFRSDSLVNRNAGGSYAAAIDAWRKWRLSVAVMREGYPPTGTDWKEMCQGRIDIIEWSGDLINVTGRGEEAVLLDFWIATERQYGSIGGIAMETVIQSMNDNNLVALSPALYTPVSPSFLMNTWTQQKGNLFPADVAVASKAGAVLRYRYDASNVHRLTLFKPDRSAAPGSEVWTLSANEYTSVQKMSVDKSGIRNFIKLRYAHPTLGVQTVIYPHMAGTGTVSCAAGVATFSSSQAGIIKGAADNSNTEIIVAGIAYTVTAFNGTTGATLLSQLATGGVPTFGASAFTLHDTLSGGGTTTSLGRFGRVDLEIDLSYETQVNDSTKAQGFCDAVGSDKEFPDLEQQFETLGFWFVQLHDYGKFEANGIHYDTPQYGGVTAITHSIADGTIKTTLNVRGKPSGAYRNWDRLGRSTVSTGPRAPLDRRTPYLNDGQFAGRSTSPDGLTLHSGVTDNNARLMNKVLVKTNVSDPDTLDGVPDGATYARLLASKLVLNVLKRAGTFDDGGTAARTTDASGLVLHSGVTDNAARPMNKVLVKTNVADPDTLDGVPDGSTYGRPLATRLSSGKPLIDFSEGIHINKTIDNVSDGATRKAVTSIDGAGKAIIDLSQAHTNKTLDNLGDGATYKRVTGVVSNLVTADSATSRNRCKLVLSGTGSQATGTSPTLITTWSESATGGSDIGGLHDDVTNASRITVPTGGGGKPWFLTASVSFQFNATGDRYIEIRKNGTAVQVVCMPSTKTASNSTVIPISFFDPSPIATDYYEVAIWQNSGSTLNISSGTTDTSFCACHLW